MEKLDITPLKYENDKLMILDQTRLPGEEVYEEMSTAEDVWDAIYRLIMEVLTWRNLILHL